jgi:hypothetical protein
MALGAALGLLRRCGAVPEPNASTRVAVAGIQSAPQAPLLLEEFGSSFYKDRLLILGTLLAYLQFGSFTYFFESSAQAIDFEALVATLEAAAVIDYRAKHGNFKSIEGLKKVPGINPKKIEAKRNAVVF